MVIMVFSGGALSQIIKPPAEPFIPAWDIAGFRGREREIRKEKHIERGEGERERKKGNEGGGERESRERQ